jgi:hypothetical protein
MAIAGHIGGMITRALLTFVCARNARPAAKARLTREYAGGAALGNRTPDLRLRDPEKPSSPRLQEPGSPGFFPAIAGYHCDV